MANQPTPETDQAIYERIVPEEVREKVFFQLFLSIPNLDKVDVFFDTAGIQGLDRITLEGIWNKAQLARQASALQTPQPVYEDFCTGFFKKLSGCVIDPKLEVIDKMIDHYSSQLPYANENRLKALYCLAQQIPSSSARKIVAKEYDNLRLHDVLQTSHGGRGVVLKAFRKCVPFVVKLSIGDDCEFEYFQQLGSYDPSSIHIVGPTEQIIIRHQDQSEGKGLVLPMYLASLADIPTPLSQEAIEVLWISLTKALEFIHSKHIIHCDIKASNILVDAQGCAFLADFGAAIDFGSWIHETTPGIAPTDFDHHQILQDGFYDWLSAGFLVLQLLDEVKFPCELTTKQLLKKMDEKSFLKSFVESAFASNRK